MNIIRAAAAGAARAFAAMMPRTPYGGLRTVAGKMLDLSEAAKADEIMTGRDFFGTLVLRVP